MPAATEAPDGPPVDADRDAARLRELGYPQQLRRRLGLLDGVAVGFTTISPVVGLYAVAVVGLTVAGPAWVWVLPVALAGQCLLLALYAELASEFPLANGLYQWTRRITTPAYGWFTGWVGACAYVGANTTIAYLAAPWALVVLGIEPTPVRLVATAAVVIAFAAAVNAGGVDALRRAVRVGAATEILASVGVGLALLVAFRAQSPAVLTETLGAEAASGGSTSAAALAALAVAGWAFLGFDATVAAGEETHAADRAVPRAVWAALLAVGVLVIVDAVAVTLAHPDLAAVVGGRDADPVTTAVTTALGAGAARPFAALTLAAFVACAVAAQGATARMLFSAARDGVLPASWLLRKVDRRGVPVGALGVAAVLGGAGLLLGLEATAIGSLIAFGTAAFYLAFLMLAAGALAARLRGRWIPAGTLRLGRAGTVLNVLAVVWLAVEAVNVAWPRAALAPLGAPWYQRWAALLVLAVVVVAGLAYLASARPHRRLGEPAASGSQGIREGPA